MQTDRNWHDSSLSQEKEHKKKKHRKHKSKSDSSESEKEESYKFLAKIKVYESELKMKTLQFLETLSNYFYSSNGKYAQPPCEVKELAVTLSGP